MKELALRFLLDTTRSSGTKLNTYSNGYVAINLHIQWPIFNFAILRLDQEHDTEIIDSVKQLSGVLAAHNRKPSFAIINPVKPLVAKYLSEMGLQPHEDHQIYFAATNTVKEEDIDSSIVVRKVDPSKGWLHLLLDGFEVPESARQPFITTHSHILQGDSRSHLFEALIEGVSVGAAMLWVENDIAGLNTATVKPEFRRRGIYKALYNSRIRAASNLDAKWIATETAQPSVVKIVERSGFKPVLSFSSWF